MALIYDPSIDAYVDDGTGDGSTSPTETSPSSWTPPAGATQNSNGTYTQTFDDGSTLTYNADGSIASDTNATDSGIANAPTGSNFSLSGILSGLNSSLGLKPGTINLANLGTGAAAAAMLTGGNKVQTGIADVTIPQYTAVNQGIAPGPAGMGQAYFTPTQFVSPSNVAAAQATAANQAAIMTPPAAQPTALPPANIATKWQTNGQATQAAPQTPTQSGIAQVATPQQIQAMQAQLSNLQGNPAQIENLVKQPIVQRAHGGTLPGGIAGMAHGGRYLQGSTDGMADKLDTSIDDVQPAKLSHGEFVIPADVVSHLGNGNSDAGAKKLYQMMDKIRMARTGTTKQGKEINPDKFMPGGIAGYAAGGGVKHFATGSQVSTSPSATTTLPASSGYGTTTATGLSPYAAPVVTDMLAKQQALTNAPAPVYTGELAAGPSTLQNQYFANANQLASTGITPTQFTTQGFDTNAVNQYMNPYLQASLNPQLQALQLSAQQGEQGDLSKLTQAGAYGGTRQAVLQGQDAYNLLAQQSNLIGQGYNTAYNNAMNEFNTVNSQNLQKQQNQEAANEAAANYGLASNAALGTAGATQQAIKQAQDTASLNQFNQQVAWQPTQLSNLNTMLSSLPISTAATTPNTTSVGKITDDLSSLQALYNIISGVTNPSPAPSPAPSSGTTGGGSSGTTSDIRAKENIELIEIRPDGLGVYEFDYKPEFKDWPSAGHGRFRGLMAHEVEKVYPDAVTMISGYKAVDYSKVGY